MKHKIDKDGYHCIHLSNGKPKHYYIHRLIYQHFGKNWNSELTIDHIDGNKENNHISNLRMATQQQQLYNRKIQKRNKLGIKGVYKRRNKYLATISINGKQNNIGLFKTIEEASLAYQIKAKELHGEFFKE
jgi:hypothetical protein